MSSLLRECLGSVSGGLAAGGLILAAIALSAEAVSSRSQAGADRGAVRSANEPVIHVLFVPREPADVAGPFCSINHVAGRRDARTCRAAPSRSAAPVIPITEAACRPAETRTWL